MTDWSLGNATWTYILVVHMKQYQSYEILLWEVRHCARMGEPKNDESFIMEDFFSWKFQFLFSDTYKFLW
jgi:hypothetical protein